MSAPRAALADRVAIITGAGGGIGRLLSTGFAAAGARVVLTDRDPDKLQEAVELVDQAGGTAVGVAGDLTDSAVADAVAQTAVDRFGRLDCAVDGAAFYPPDAPLPDVDESVARQAMEVDFWATFHCLRAQIRTIRATGGQGSLVVISSGAGILGHPGNAVYSAAKHAIVGMARTAALDHSAEGIRVNVICPGMIETPPLQAWLDQAPEMRQAMTARHPIGRLGRPHEIADVAVWLCSDQSSFVTGAVIAADGGYTAL